MHDLNKHLLLQLHMILWFACHFSFNKTIEDFELREGWGKTYFHYIIC